MADKSDIVAVNISLNTGSGASANGGAGGGGIVPNPKRITPTSILNQRINAKQATATTATLVTFHETRTVEVDATRFRFAVRNSNASPMVVSDFIVAVTSVLSAAVVPTTGVWKRVTFNAGQTGVTVPAGTLNRPSELFSDWIDIATIPRTDTPGALPVVMSRMLLAIGPYSYGQLEVAWMAATSGQNSGRGRYCWRTLNDAVTNPASMTGQTAFPYVLTGMEYVATRNGITILTAGDSILEGVTNSTTLANNCYGWARQSVDALRLANPNLPIELANYAQASSPTLPIKDRLKDILANGTNFNLVLYTPFSPNDGIPSQDSIDAEKLYLEEVLTILGQRGVPVIIGDPTPNNTQNWTAAQDAFRLQMKGYIDGLRLRGYDIIPIDLAMSNQAVPARFIPAFTDDGTHPNVPGHAEMARYAIPIIAQYVSQ